MHHRSIRTQAQSALTGLQPNTCFGSGMDSNTNRNQSCITLATAFQCDPISERSPIYFIIFSPPKQIAPFCASPRYGIIFFFRNEPQIQEHRFSHQFFFEMWFASANHPNTMKTAAAQYPLVLGPNMAPRPPPQLGAKMGARRHPKSIKNRCENRSKK